MVEVVVGGAVVVVPVVVVPVVLVVTQWQEQSVDILILFPYGQPTNIGLYSHPTLAATTYAPLDTVEPSLLTR